MIVEGFCLSLDWTKNNDNDGPFKRLGELCLYNPNGNVIALERHEFLGEQNVEVMTEIKPLSSAE
jgi:hypothetical protein